MNQHCLTNCSEELAVHGNSLIILHFSIASQKLIVVCKQFQLCLLLLPKFLFYSMIYLYVLFIVIKVSFRNIFYFLFISLLFCS